MYTVCCITHTVGSSTDSVVWLTTMWLRVYKQTSDFVFSQELTDILNRKKVVICSLFWDYDIKTSFTAMMYQVFEAWYTV